MSLISQTLPEPVAAPAGEDKPRRGGFSVARALPFFTIHLTCLAAFLVHFRWSLVVLCLGMYYARMFFVTAGYHRYFSHRSFKTSRVFQFLLAFLAMTSAQKGVLWWAAHHRRPHRYSDTEEDLQHALQMRQKEGW